MHRVVFCLLYMLLSYNTTKAVYFEIGNEIDTPDWASKAAAMEQRAVALGKGGTLRYVCPWQCGIEMLQQGTKSLSHRHLVHSSDPDRRVQHHCPPAMRAPGTPPRQCLLTQASHKLPRRLLNKLPPVYDAFNCVDAHSMEPMTSS